MPAVTKPRDQDPESPSSDFLDDPDVRVAEDGSIEIRKPDERAWVPATRSQLARDYPADHVVWIELRRHGLRRPSPSGPRPPDAVRNRRLYTLRLLPADAARVDAMAERLGLCRSALVVRLVNEAETVYGTETTYRSSMSDPVE